MKEYYTLVLKGHIDLAMSEFPRGTTGKELDEAARKPLLDRGLDYNHGTGHGVGHVLSVHEGPNYISYRSNGEQELIPGMQGGKAGVLSFCLGFSLMMALDVALG